MMNNSPDDLQSRNNPDRENQTSLFNQERNRVSMITNESHDTHQRPSPGRGIHSSHSNQDESSLSETPGIEISGTSISNSCREGNTFSIKAKKVSNTPQKTMGPSGDVDQENFIVALRSEKGLDKLPPRRNPDNVVHGHAAHSDQGVTFSKLPEKPTMDGYNWRKYGQKLVKGNTLVRSYYKCTFSNCPARKQVERSHDGHITEINYLWKHEHPKPPHTLLKGSAFVLPVQARASDEPSLTTSEDNSSMHPATSHEPEQSETRLPLTVAASENVVEVAVSQSPEIKSGVNNNIPPDSKRQKRESSSVNDSIVTKTSCEPRVVVQTTSAVDIVNDGYRWRKYGQKLVKGNRNPRSYYRCSSGGCSAKKHVERAAHDEKVVITTYEGRHDHDMPAGGRTVTHGSSEHNTGTSAGSRPQPDTSESAGMEMVVPVSAA